MAQRQGAFAAFDLEQTGLLTQFDLRFAVQAVDSIAELLSEKDVMMAMRRCGIKQGQLVSFKQFSQMCDFFEAMRQGRNDRREYVNELVLAKKQHDVEEVQNSPRRTVYNSPSGEDDPGLPQQSPTGGTSRALLADHFANDPISHAFFAFDMDCTGAVSAIELQNMLTMVPRRSGKGSLGPEGKKQAKYEQALHQVLSKVGKAPTDLLNLHDFQAIIEIMDPPPPPPPPQPPTPVQDGDEEHPAGAAEPEECETASQIAERERLEEEARLAQEAKEEAERVNATTLMIQYDGGYIAIPYCSEADKVSAILGKIAEKLGNFDPKDLRLLGMGRELDPRKPLGFFSVKVGHPESHGGDIVQLLTRSDASAGDGADDYVSGMLNVQRADGVLMQVYVEDDEPIEYIQIRLEEQEGTPVPFQRLVVFGREINPKKTLRDYNVSLGADGDIVHLLVREAGAPDPSTW
eukprot:TRINITY_DN1119_c2_g1_i1.p1 TRINITY_DN1119_c2_g1~~TRINITY_DN1119_c2_g1_i1.p1  ORF type:complete len:490 (+),score=216.90 TRINITY_DN1119_c2_g1_i1:85-1470(+)